MNKNIIITFVAVNGIDQVLKSILRLNQEESNWKFGRYKINSGNSGKLGFNENRMILFNTDVDDIFAEIIVVCEDEYLERVKLTLEFFQKITMLNHGKSFEPNIIVYNQENLNEEYRDILEINAENVKPIK